MEEITVTGGRNTSSLHFFLGSLSPYCPCPDVIVMNRGKSMFYFGFDFQIDQISFLTLASGGLPSWKFNEKGLFGLSMFK